MLERYFELLPEYIGKRLSDVKFKRVLFAGMPCYKSGPLQTSFDRVIQVSHFTRAHLALTPYQWRSYKWLPQCLPVSKLTSKIQTIWPHNLAYIRHDLPHENIVLVERVHPKKSCVAILWSLQARLFHGGRIWAAIWKQCGTFTCLSFHVSVTYQFGRLVERCFRIWMASMDLVQEGGRLLSTIRSSHCPLQEGCSANYDKLMGIVKYDCKCGRLV